MRKDIERLILQARRDLENARKRHELGIVSQALEDGLPL